MLQLSGEVESCHGLIAYCSFHLGQLKLGPNVPRSTARGPPIPLLHAPATNALFPYQLDFIHQLTSTVESLR